MRSVQAKIIDNRPVCECNNCDFSPIIDYDLCNYKELKLYKFTRRCNRCDKQIHYYKTISLREKDKYYEVNENKINILK